MSPGPHRRAGFVCIVLALVLSAYSARLVHLQVGKHEEYARVAADTTAKRNPVRAERGKIVDVNGEILADNVPIYKIVVDSKVRTDVQRTKLADILARCLSLPVGQITERLATKRPYVVMQKNVSAEIATKLKTELAEAKLRGVTFEPEPKRNYPNDNMLAHVLGFLDHEGRGIQGVEMMMEPYLRGEDGFVYTERDRTGREIVAYRSVERPARNGMTVQLTVDMGLQDIVERELDDSYKRLNPNMITAVFVRPRTGEVLAMATRPAFNPNDHANAPIETTKNRAIVDMFEPGSTFKLVVVSAALNEQAVTAEQKFNCENGNFFYGGKSLHDVHKYGELSVHDILVKSSNIGCAKIGLHLGADTFYEYIRRFGFGDRSGLGLPGEIPGLVHPVHQWSGLSITRVTMGQEVAVTPLQSVMSMSVIASGGNMMLPKIVHSVRDQQGHEVLSFHPQVVRRVISEETAAKIGEALRGVVSEDGTAPLAAISGYPVAGKTGTAQKPNPAGGYLTGQYVVSFAGYFPADDPEVAGIILVDNPRTPGTSTYGGTIAGPIFSRIGAAMARHLDLPARQDETEGTTIAQVPPANKPDGDLN